MPPIAELLSRREPEKAIEQTSKEIALNFRAWAKSSANANKKKKPKEVSV